MLPDQQPGFFPPDNRGHFLRPDFQYSFPVGEPRERMYQILQPILQKISPIAKPEIYDALMSNDPQELFDFLGISFTATAKKADIQKIKCVRDRYDGEIHVVPFVPQELVFTLMTAENFQQSIYVVGSAYARSIERSVEGKHEQVILDRQNPYSLYYFILPRVSESEISLTPYAQKHLDRGVSISSEDEGEFDAVGRVNIQTFDVVRGFMNASRASSGNLSGLPSIS